MAPYILLVEVEPRSSSTAQQLLNEAGYRTRVASCFEDACCLLSVERPDLLITAVRLGRFNGLHLALQCLALHPNAPVLVLGTPADGGLASEAANFGARFVCDVAGPSDLLTIIADLIAPGVPKEFH